MSCEPQAEQACRGAFVDVAAFVADGDAHVHAEVVAAGLRGDVQERAVARFGQGFVKVQVQRGAAVEPVHQFFAVQQEFVERVDFFRLRQRRNRSCSIRG